MNRVFTFVVIFIGVLLITCNTVDTKQQSNANAVETANTPFTLNSSQYHRYAGSIAGQPVIVNLYVQPQRPGDDAGGYIVSGNYYYVGKSRLIMLDPNGERKMGDTILMGESVETDRREDQHGQALWRVTADENGLHGIWTGADKNTTHTIDLKEQYEAGAYPLDVLVYADSAVVNRQSGRNVLQSWFMLLTPAKQWKADEAAFVTSAILHEWQDDTATDMGGYVARKKQNLFSEYRKMMDEDGAENRGEIDNHSYSVQMTCEYNCRGMLVLTATSYSYTGGAHGNYGTQYMCLDVQEKKVWRMSDVVADTNAMPMLLAEEVRELYGMKPEQKLSEYLFEDVVKPSDNIAISDVGITFHYTPYEIASYASGEIPLFVPYSKLLPYLTAGFRKRICK